jgi:hypothetical protein
MSLELLEGSGSGWEITVACGVYFSFLSIGL